MRRACCLLELNQALLAADCGLAFSWSDLSGGTGTGVLLVTGWSDTEPAPAGACFVSARPAWESSGFDPVDATFPFLKNGVSACATSPGVWNRRPGSFAIILATTAASSTGTSGRTRFSGPASIEKWAW